MKCILIVLSTLFALHGKAQINDTTNYYYINFGTTTSLNLFSKPDTSYHVDSFQVNWIMGVFSDRSVKCFAADYVVHSYYYIHHYVDFDQSYGEKWKIIGMYKGIINNITCIHSFSETNGNIHQVGFWLADRKGIKKGNKNFSSKVTKSTHP